MRLSDKALRGKYLWLVVAQMMDVLRHGPPREAVEAEIGKLLEWNPELHVPRDEVFVKPGVVLGRIITMAHNAIYNYELGDHRERKSEEASYLS